MREMKDSGIEWIGEIPADWKLKRIKYELKNRVEKNNPILSKNILSLTAKQGVIPLEEKEGGGNKPKEDFSAYHLAYPGDIVMNSMNILSGSVGISKYFGCVSPVYYMLRPFNEKNDVRFYNYIFQTEVFQKSLFGLGNGILIKESDNGKFNTIRMRISMDTLGRLFIPVASAVEQKRIADFLDEKCREIDLFINDIQKQIDKIKEYKDSLISEAVTKGLDKNVAMKDSGVEWLGEIPSDWEITRIKYISDGMYKGNGITKEEVFEEGNTPCVRYGEIYSKYNDYFEKCCSKTNKEILSLHRYFEHGDILFTCTGELVEEIGKNIVYLGYEKCLAGGDIVVLKHSQNPLFLNYVLNSKYVQNQKSIGKQKLKVVHISSENIENLVVAIPNINVQKRISDFLREKCKYIDETISIKKKQIDILKDSKKSIIYEYIIGKKEVIL